MKPSSTDFTPSSRAPRAPSAPTKSRVSIEPEMSTASMTSRAASVRSIGSPTHSGRARVSTTSAQSSQAKAICQPERGRTTAPSPLSRPALAASKNGMRTRLHHLAARRREPEHEERQRQRDERPGEGELKHGWRPDPAAGGGERGAAVEGGGRAVGRVGQRRGRAGRSRRRSARGSAVQPSPVSGATSARGAVASATRRSSVWSRASAPGSPASSAGARARSSASAARRQAVARRWRSQAQEAEGERGEEERGERRPRPRSAGIIETGGGSTMSWSWSRRSTRLSAALRLHQRAPARRRAEQAEELRHGRLAGADRQDGGVEALLPGEEPRRAGRRRRRRGCGGRGRRRGRARPAGGRRRRRCGPRSGISRAEGSWTRARTRSLPRAMPVEDAQRRVVGAVEVGDDEEQPVVGDDPGGLGERGVEARRRRRRRRAPRRRGRGCGRRRGRAGAGRRRGCGGRGRRRVPASERTRPPTRSPCAEDAPGGERGDLGGGDRLHVEDGAEEHRLALVDDDAAPGGRAPRG